MALCPEKIDSKPGEPITGQLSVLEVKKGLLKRGFDPVDKNGPSMKRITKKIEKFCLQNLKSRI